MYRIFAVNTSSTAFFAAEELKKYLRMMMPRAGDIPVSYDTASQNGFRLGLMSDFGLDTSDAEDTALDDIVYINTTENSGIIAGSNYGALVIAVYRYLRFCGCRWLFPGIDGEWIPTVDKLPKVNYRKKADHRYRGQCNEGAEFQTSMLEVIDFTPKIGLNTFMMEFDVPFMYYDWYYQHHNNFARKPEPVTPETVLKWKRQCEVEIQKRGLHFHDMGHGWTTESFGIDSTKTDIPEEKLKEVGHRLALVNGKRGKHDRVLTTNFCMSSAENRQIVANYVSDYAETQNNVDFLHIWLADGRNNHCECDECRKKTVPDWYVILLNDIDAELARRNLSTHLVFIVYTETFWPPLEEKLNNSKRFTMLYAPSKRKYNESYAKEPNMDALTPFNLNHNIAPTGMADCLAYLEAWKKVWPGDCFSYEYHFWVHQHRDPSGMAMAKYLYEDIKALHLRGLSGIVEDGSQRSFFPTGFPFYVYGESLFDSSVDFEYLAEDYFSHAFGENWKQVYDFLIKIRDHIDFVYMEGNDSADPEKGMFYNPGMSELAKKVPDIVDEFKITLDQNINQPYRASSVAWQLIEHFCVYVKMLAKAIEYNASGDVENAKLAAQAMYEEMSKHEPYIERWFDQYELYYANSWIFGLKQILFLI